MEIIIFNYILIVGALWRLTRRRDPDVYVRMLARAHEFSSTIVGGKMGEMQLILEQSNAFLEHTEGKLNIIATINRY